MSGGPASLESGGGGGSSSFEQISPKLVQSNGNLEFNPISVTRLALTLPWETESRQLQCGETVTDNNGDYNGRLVMEAVATKTQLEQLQQMRSEPSNARLIAPLYNGPVTFDEMQIERVPEANGAIVRGGGETGEPIYEVQLQSKDADCGEDSVIGEGE
jgi:hypothetical protein